MDRAAAAGLDFVHDNGMTGHYYFPENMAPGVGLFDYDNDGDLDVYVVQGVTLDPSRPQGAAPNSAAKRGDRLYRNDLRVESDGRRTLHFTDITDGSGIVSRGFGMGVATGDFNNDGWIDLYTTRFGRNQLFRNNGDGTFTDVSAASGTDDPSWSVSATFVDYDRDGWLDLYVGNYLLYNVEHNLRCASQAGGRDYCPPASYKPAADRLFRNRGDGTFVDVTSRAHIDSASGPALGVVADDFNGDGWPDIYVANDGAENLLWMNQHDGTFRNDALRAGAALSAEGKAEAGMGVDAGDYDNDGDDDLLLTHLTLEGHNVYRNEGSGVFEDVSSRVGIGPPTLPFTGWGTAWIDYDNDGLLDVLTVSGTIIVIEKQQRAGDPFPRRQRKQLLHNIGGTRFEDVSARAGAVFALEDASRGAAFGDIDNDGDVDVVVANINAPLRLLVNDIGNRNHWVGLRLMSGMPARPATGARVEVTTADGRVLWRRAHADGSYASANDPRVLVGLGPQGAVARLRVHWPSGAVQELRDVPNDRWTTVVEGGGR